MSSTRSLHRAFELQVAVERIQLENQDKITCLELSGDTLFVGTFQGQLVQYHLEERARVGSHGKVDFNSKKTAEINLGSRSPVTFIRSASALNRLLVLCDGTLSVLSMTDLSILPLQGSSKLKNVNACCVNENPHSEDPFSVQMCLGKKKQLSVISLTEEKLTVENICELSDQVVNVSMNGIFVCAALARQYVMYNVHTGHCQELFPVEGMPVIARVSKEEFLLSAPGDLGMFVTAAGMSERPPIQWSKPPTKFVHCQPYIIAMTRDGVAVYSVLDQIQKQALHFTGAETIGNFDGKLIIASSNSVYSILPIPIETQIQTLLDNGNIKEALELAENFQHRGRTSKEQFQQILNQVRVKAGFVCLKSLELDKAMELFLNGMLNPCELISLYPRLLPSSTNFVRAVPPLHDLADINSICKGNSQRLSELQDFLKNILRQMRLAGGNKLEIDTALVRLLVPSSPLELLQLLNDPDLACDLEDCKSTLELHGRHHGLALLNERNGYLDSALSTWAELLRGGIEDDAFPGLEFFIRKLKSSSGDLVWRYADFVLEQDPVKGLALFVQADQLENTDREEKVVNFLCKYPTAQLLFLEHLVLEMHSQVEKFHTQLASKYLDLIEANHGDDRLRRKFQALIVSSSLVNPGFLLSQLEKTSLELEKAILYGKMGDHDRALKIMVYTKPDAEAAESYCDQMSANKDLAFKQTLLHKLLRIYLDPNYQITSPILQEVP